MDVNEIMHFTVGWFKTSMWMILFISLCESIDMNDIVHITFLLHEAFNMNEVV